LNIKSIYFGITNEDSIRSLEKIFRESGGDPLNNYLLLLRNICCFCLDFWRRNIRNEREISSWLRSRENRYTIDYSANTTVGITLRRRASKASATSRLRIVLQRSAKLPPGYFILTAYPA
jgi:hypothetical protein